MRKRIIALFQAVIILTSFVACKSNKEPEYSTFESIITITESDETGNAGDNNNSTGGSNAEPSASQSVSGGEVDSSSNNKKAESVANLNFGGKTIKMAITNDKTPTESNKKMFSDFEKAYNCKLSYDVIDFGNFLKTISAKLAGNQPYDIIYFHGSFFPTSVINRLLQPLDGAIAEEDKYNASNPNKGGIDMNKTDFYLWNNRHYGVAGQNDINVPLCYYNKQKFKDAGLEDPYELYKKGAWTWDKFIEMGRRVTNASKKIYFTDAAIKGNLVPSFGGSFVKYNSPTDVKENTSDPKIFNALKLLQEMSVGQNKIINTGAGNSSDASEFLAGNTYLYVSEDIRYSATISPAIIDKGRLGGNVDNVGICPIPLGGGNTSYPGNFVQGVGSMRGSSDIRYAVAFAYFRANWKDTVNDKYQLPEYARNLVNELTANPNISINHLGYDTNDGTGNSSVVQRCHFITQAVMNGDDITKTLNKYKGSIQDAIDVTLKKK